MRTSTRAMVVAGLALSAIAGAAAIALRGSSTTEDGRARALELRTETRRVCSPAGRELVAFSMGVPNAWHLTPDRMGVALRASCEDSAISVVVHVLDGEASTIEDAWVWRPQDFHALVPRGTYLGGAKVEIPAGRAVRVDMVGPTRSYYLVRDGLVVAIECSARDVAGLDALTASVHSLAFAR